MPTHTGTTPSPDEIEAHCARKEADRRSPFARAFNLPDIYGLPPSEIAAHEARIEAHRIRVAKEERECIAKMPLEDVTVADLEAFGVDYRTISILEHAGLILLGDVLSYTEEQLCSIPSMGPTAVKKVIRACRRVLRLLRG